MNQNKLRNHLNFGLVFFVFLCLSQPANAAGEGSVTNYEAEDLSLKNFGVAPQLGAFNDSIITLEADYGTATRTSGFSGNYDLCLTYLVEGEGNCIFEIYIDDVLVDSWLANQYGGVYTNDPLNRVFHMSQNIALEKSSRIEIVGYTSEGEHCTVDRLGIAETTIDDSHSNLTWNTNGSMKSLSFKGTNYLNTSKSSGVELDVSEGVQLRSSSANRIEVNNQNVQLIKESSYSDRSYSFRVERYEHHIKLRLLNMEGIPKRDRSLGLRLNIPYSSSLDFLVLDDQIEVEKKSNTLTVYWTKLATRHIVPGGYLAIYATSDKAAALNEINTRDEIVIPPPEVAPSNISLSTYRFTENNAIGDTIAVLSAEDPQGDIASYALISGDGDTENDKFLIVDDLLKANAVFDYEEGSLAFIRVEVRDSASNTYEQVLILAIDDDESDNTTGITANSKFQDIRIYPNPTKSHVYISSNKKGFVEIVGLDGKVVYAGNLNGELTTINMEGLTNGLYFVKISNDNRVITQKIIKQE